MWILDILYGTAYLTRPFSVKTTFVPCFIQLGLGVTIEKRPRGRRCPMPQTQNIQMSCPLPSPLCLYQWPVINHGNLLRWYSHCQSFWVNLLASEHWNLKILVPTTHNTTPFLGGVWNFKVYMLSIRDIAKTRFDKRFSYGTHFTFSTFT